MTKEKLIEAIQEKSGIVYSEFSDGWGTTVGSMIDPDKLIKILIKLES